MLAGSLGVLTACDSTGGTDPVTPAAPVDLAVYGSATVSAAAMADGLRLVQAGRYALLPQFASDSDYATPRSTRASVPDFQFAIGGGGTSATASVASTGDRPSARAAERRNAALHLRFRDIEAEEAPRARAWAQRLRAAPAPDVRLRAAQAAMDTVRTFKVRNSLNTATFTTVTARLKYAGSNILLYVDQAAPTANGFDDAEYGRFGVQFDQILFPIDTAIFGATGDTDGNRRTFVLFTPLVNRLTTGEPCGTYVAGYFDGADLSGNPNANRGEIFYSSVPGEPTGVGCQALRADEVRRLSPATFIHELQHLISYNQHVLLRGGGQEDVWLNEGISHIAEELGGKYYEDKYPCPNLPPCPLAGRASASQIWPDSAQGFSPPNFGNAYDYFVARRDFSMTSPTSFGTLEERGAGWLFLRWLVDQKGQAILTRLVQTRSLGVDNVESVAAEPFETLFADFLAAVVLDDYPGAPSGALAPRQQIPSRNLRAIYARLNTVQSNVYPLAYPVAISTIGIGSALTPSSPVQTVSMKPGTFDLFTFTSTTPSSVVRFGAPAGSSFARRLNPQLTVIRLP
jgi:hypothetical protein